MTLVFEPRRKGENARDYAYAVLRENIANLNLEPGCTLNDVVIAEQLGVSRTPVREALNQLKSESEIIEVYPQRCIKVALIDTEIIQEVRLMRLLIEKDILRRCCDMATEKDLLWMEENVDLQRFHYGRRDMEKALEKDNELHRYFYSITGCDYIYRSTRGPMIHYDRVRVLETFYNSYLDSIDDHEEIIGAIREKDPEHAEKLITLHLGRWVANEQKLRIAYPQYFRKEETENEGSESNEAGGSSRC